MSDHAEILQQAADWRHAGKGVALATDGNGRYARLDPYAGAQLALAVRYANGDGVRQSYPEALKWFRRAQAQGAVPRQGKAAELWSKVQEWAQSHPQEK